MVTITFQATLLKLMADHAPIEYWQAALDFARYVDSIISMLIFGHA